MKTFRKRFDGINREFNLINSQSYQPSPIAPMRFVELPDKCFKFVSDINYIFNQMRLVRALGAASVDAWLSGFDTRQTGIDTSKFTDDELLMFIKSRNIQTPSELRAWSDYLMSNVEQVKGEMKRYVDSYLQELKSRTTVVEDVEPPKTE